MPNLVVFIPKPARVMLDQIQTTHHPDLTLGQIMYLALAIYLRDPDIRAKAKEEVTERKGARAPRRSKKAEPQTVQPEKAQAPSPASQSKGILRAPPTRVPATGTKGT